MNELVNNLTQKDETKALQAAKSMIDNKNVEAFKKLCEKSDFLFDFVKNNVRKRLKKAINENNYKNLTAFFEVYTDEYADTFLESMARFADEDLSDEMLELLENGSLSQQKYAAKYFCFIPDTAAQELLEKYAFEGEMQLAVNSAQALGAMNARTAFDKALTQLKSEDEFELIKSVRFLTAFGDKTAVQPLLKTLETSSAAENIAGEIPYLSPIMEMFEAQDFDAVLNCFNFILLGLGEILPLSEIFTYEIYEVLQYLLNKAETKQSSHIACALLRALEKFATFDSNDEYAFDESKDVKNEIKDIYGLLTSQPKDFWKAQEQLIVKELSKTKTRAVAALEVIRALEIKSTQTCLTDFINNTEDEQLLVLAAGVAKVLGSLNLLRGEALAQKVTNNTLKAILMSYFI